MTSLGDILKTEAAAEHSAENNSRKETKSDIAKLSKRLGLEPAQERKTRVTVALENDVLKLVAKLAKDNDTSVSEVVGRITKNYLNEFAKD